MIATVMFHNWFKLGFGLGNKFQGIIETIHILAKGLTFCLGYVPTNDEVEMKRKNVDWALARPILCLYQSFPIREYPDNDGLGEGVWGLFDEINAIIEDEVEIFSIHDCDPREQLKNMESIRILITPNIFVEKTYVYACFENQW